MADIQGTDGADNLTGTDQDDVIEGFGGDDVIDGGFGADRIFGGDGDDLIRFSAVRIGNAPAIGLLDGGNGFDTVDFRNVAPVTLGTIEVAPGSYSLGAYVGSQKFQITNVDRILFGATDDTISVVPGNTQAIELRGGEGHDHFTIEGPVLAYGEDGDDDFFLSGSFSNLASHGIVDGGAGNDLLKLNIAFDVDLAAGTATSGSATFAISSIEHVQAAAVSGYSTTVRGSDAAEVLEVNPLFNDGSVGVVFEGRGGDDILSGSKGADRLDGGDGNDLLIGGAGGDTLIGGAGIDTVSYADSSASLSLSFAASHASTGGSADSLTGIENAIGSRFSDEMYGDGADNRLDGGDGSDWLSGGGGNDVLIGGAGDDSLFGGSGDDVIDGGSGHDTLDFLRGGGPASGVTVDLQAGTSTGDGNDTITGIEDVWGTSGNDVLIGDAGANHLMGDRGADVIRGGDGDDWLEADEWGSASLLADTVEGGNGNDQIAIGVNDNADGGDGVDTLTIRMFGSDQSATVDLSAMWAGGTGTVGTGTVRGFEGFDTIYGSQGDDAITIGTGAITTGLPARVLGEGGNDQLTGGEGRDSLFGDQGNDLLVGLGGNDYLDAGDGDDRIEGGAGDDRLIGGAGADTLIGGSGSDLYYYDNGETPAGDHIVEAAADAGTDTLQIYGATALQDSAFAGIRNIEVADLSARASAPNVTDFTLGSNFSATGITTVLVNGNVDATAMTVGVEFRQNYFTTMSIAAGSGDDVFSIDPQFLGPWYQTWSYDGGAGFDTLVLNAPQEAEAMNPANQTGRVLISGIEAIRLLPGSDPVSIPAGPDQPGQTEFYKLTLADEHVAQGARLIVDASGLRAGVPISLGADGEIGGTGANADLLGSDRLTLDASALTAGRAVDVRGGAGADVIVGSAAGDLMSGGGGDDVLIGGAGADVMSGGAGNDTFYVDSAADIVAEAPGEGVDRIATSVTYALLAGSAIETLEAITLSATTAMDLTGNAFDNTISGNNGVNILRGDDGVDTLFGYGGDDYLDGGLGRDTMYGGAGNDTYYVNSPNDLVFENPGEGTDRVATAVSYALAAGSAVETLETLTLSGTDPIDLSGNAFDNMIVGNNGVNVLRGDDGNDTLFGLGGNDYLDGGLGRDMMYGGAGNDTYYVNSAADQVFEAQGEGVDRVATSVSYALQAGSEVETLEALSLSGTDPLNLTGNEFANTIIGNNGANVLDGKGGNDVLIGAGGADTFAFTTAPGGSNHVSIEGFVAGSDRIALDHTVFSGLTAGALPASEFVNGGAAIDADDHILFDGNALFYDADGIGALPPIQLATIAGITGMISATDFIVI